MLQLTCADLLLLVAVRGVSLTALMSGQHHRLSGCHAVSAVNIGESWAPGHGRTVDLADFGIDFFDRREPLAFTENGGQEIQREARLIENVNQGHNPFEDRGGIVMPLF